MGNNVISKVNFEDIQTSRNTAILINTLPNTMQDCLISGTTPIASEEKLINDLLNSNTNQVIIIYGKNSNDETIYKKYNQLKNLGFTNAKLYIGGLFEWLLLQDIYGDDEFPTTSKTIELLKYKGKSLL